MSDSPEPASEPQTFDQIWESEVATQAGVATAEPAADTPASPAATPAPDSKPRDAKTGQFTARETPPAEATPVTPTDTPKADEPAPEPAKDETETLPEFSVTADKRDYGFPGSKVGPDGIFIPAASKEHLTRLLVSGLNSRQQERDFGRQLSAAKQSAAIESQKAQALIAKVYEMLGDEAQLVEFRQNWQTNRDKLVLQAELDALKADHARREQEAQEAQNERHVETLLPRMHESLKGFVGKLAETPELKGLDTKGLIDRLWEDRYRSLVFREVPDGEEPGPDLRHVYGNVWADVGFLYDEMAHLATIARQAAEREREKVKVREVNQRAVTPPAKASQPTSTTVRDKAPAFTSTREADDHIWGKGFNEL